LRRNFVSGRSGLLGSEKMKEKRKRERNEKKKERKI